MTNPKIKKMKIIESLVLKSLDKSTYDFDVKSLFKNDTELLLLYYLLIKKLYETPHTKEIILQDMTEVLEYQFSTEGKYLMVCDLLKKVSEFFQNIDELIIEL